MRYDFIVIGGGIAGLSAGARLSEHGTVLLLESESALGYHASGRSAALFEESYGLPSTLALNQASRAFFQADPHLTGPRGLMLIGKTDEDAAFEADRDAMGLAELTRDEARAMVPILNDDAARAAWREDAWDIDTDLLMQNFARAIRGNGGAVTTGAAVTAISRDAGGWQVTAGDAYEATTLVNAAGPWADRVAQMAGIAPLGLQAYRRSMARIPAPGGLDIRNWPMIFGTGESWYAKPDAGKLLVSPAEEDPAQPHDAWADDMVLAEGLARYEAMVTEPVTRLETSWAGLRTFAPDRSLVLGPDPTDRSFVWSAGQGGYGFQTAPAASRLVADLVTGQAPELPPEIVAALSPERFR
ncbi:NAD(P)/FAD-dependent oxidoreductase [Actibacterium ureilyticum]|uniref:NAD(P)/FAD-dependent oxidoreductase n=1 Tax=Actibacterium ureilyticum TaxID=1590614 RepID=UPI000BAA9962|nr:FAD-dependent oxidoreductase [Actibacterium ureilyticum]